MCNMYHKWLKQSGKAVMGLFLVMLFCNLAFAQGAGSKLAKEANERARAGDHAGAVAKYNDAIKVEPSNYKYFYKKAMSEIKLKDLANAKISLENCSRLNTTFSGSHVALAKIYTQEQDYNKAIASFNKGYDVEGDQSKKITIKLAVVKLYLKKLSKPDDAMRELQQIEGIAGSDPRVTYQKAEILGAKGQWQQALDLYKATYAKLKSVSMEGTRDGWMSLVGECVAYCKMNNNAVYTEKLNYLKTSNEKYAKAAERGCRGSAGAVGKELKLAKSYYSAGAYDEALSWVNKSLEGNKSAVGYQLAAMIYARTGQFQQAAQHYSKAAELETDAAKKTKIYAAMIKIQYSAKDYNGALNSANALLAANPKDYKILLLKAQTELKLGQNAAAIKSAEAAAANSPSPDPARTAIYNFTIGLAAKKSGDLTKAKDAFKKAEASPKFKYAAQEEAKSMGAK